MVELLILLAVLLGSLGVGYALISRVPPLLHTPLMSMTNAISAVTVLGALVLFGRILTIVEVVITGIALVAAAFNIIGGLAITERMLRMFRKM